MSTTLELDLPDTAFSALRVSPKEFGVAMRLAAAVKWFEAGMLSQGKAAEIAGVSRAEFIDALSRFEVSPIQETADELRSSLSRA
jgi:predicted HTH domain antitoxin